MTHSSSWGPPFAQTPSSTIVPSPSRPVPFSAWSPSATSPPTTEFYESRHFAPGPTDTSMIDVAGQLDVPFGTHQLFSCDDMPSLVVAAEICEDLWVPSPPSIGHAQAGATLVCNLSASNAIVGKSDYRRSLVTGQSARLVCAYVYASAGWGESTQDLVFAGHDMVAENGHLLAEGRPFGGRCGHLRDRPAAHLWPSVVACPPFAARRHPRARAMP